MGGAFVLAPTAIQRAVDSSDVDDGRELLVALFDEHAPSLVRLARLFVDDRDAAEDLVQEAFLRLARNLDRVDDRAKVAPYLRSIVLNLARDHNRRGLVSLRHHERMRTDADTDAAIASTRDVGDDLQLAEDQRAVVEAVRALPRRQRDCVVLRYYVELSVADVATTLGLSVNSVKTHLQRAFARLEDELDGRR
ncbi:MAG TPA: sigma-70 family RNA polymerase sigma factor [Acidimicrobiales bacterium]|jgi:RNA polymerase sigma factor (sigma-70 family)|nr:sigma-70 family RNA polymerase sigma factor [Acidimicrobiales bacterium]